MKTVAAACLAAVLAAAGPQESGAAAGEKKPAPPAPPAPPVRKTETGDSISVGDVIEIRVVRRDDLNLSFPVPPGGTVTFPLVGRLKVIGKHPEEVAAELKKRLTSGGHLARPDVTVIIREFAPKLVYVFGAVKSMRAVTLPPDGRLTLMQAMAMVGGFQDDADSKEVRVLRRVKGGGKGQAPSTRVICVDVDAITEHDKTELDVRLKAGDTIIVPKRDGVFVLGQVARPGAYALARGKWTLTRMIAKAGGFTQYARSTRVRVISRPPPAAAKGAERSKGSIRTVDVRLIVNTGDLTKDVELLPGDIVFVPESIF